MAKYIAEIIYPKEKYPELEFDSAGTRTLNNFMATENAMSALEKLNSNIIDHRSKRVQDLDLTNYNLIVCMTIQNAYDLYPNLFTRFLRWCKILETPSPLHMEVWNIPDPYGCDLDVYKYIVHLLETKITQANW
jgi:protein-tyrosine-phosphatase